MISKTNRCFAGFIVFFCLITTIRAQEIRGVIQPLNISAGAKDTVVVSDMFYAKSYELHFLPSEKIAVDYDRKTHTAVFTAKENSFGASLVEFSLHGRTASIPVIVRSGRASQQLHTFVYKSQNVNSKIFVTGSFNNWSREKDRLIDMKEKGVFELTLPLDPGTYAYKFVVDGKDVLDPSNPEKSPTGFDDFNSLLRIADKDTTKLFLHIGGWREKANGYSYSFFYENTGNSGEIAAGDIIALVNNARLDPSAITIDTNAFAIRLKKTELLGDKILRVLVSQRGKTTNIQQVVLQNGIPAGRTSQHWRWSDGTIYSLLIDRFNDGDKANDKPVVNDSIFYQANYQGGDFKGISDKIDEGYFDSLGVNTLWISPVNDNPDDAYREYPPPHRWYSGYHGYWPISDTRVEEKFGTMNDLKRLVAEAHKHHLKVLLDLVAHHVHIEHPFYKNHPEWFGTLDLPDGRKNLRLWDEYRLTTWFEPYMPSFDFIKSDEAVRVVSDNAVWWLQSTGADGFRHDAVKHVPNKFWRVLTRKLIEEIEIPMKKEVYQIGETFGDNDLIASYVNIGQLSAQFNFNLSYFAIPIFLEPGRSFASLDFHLKQSFEAFGYNNLMGNIMDSHDKVRFMAYADGKVQGQGIDTREMAWNNPPTVDHPSSYKKAELYLAYMFTIPGLPVIYYGSEFGMTGADDPDNRRMMRFGDALSVYERQMLDETKKIVKIRRQHSALRYGDFLALRADTAVFAYVRSDMNERVLVTLNKSERGESISVDLPEVYHSKMLIDIITGRKIIVKDGGVAIDIPPIGWRVFEVR
jgi:cyclomaltodextrinase